MDSIESPAKINKRKRLVTTAVEITMQTGVTKQPKGKQNKQINSNKLKGSQRGCKEVNQSNEDVNKLQGETAYERLYKMVKDNHNVRNVPKVRSTRSNHSPLRSELPQRQQPQKKNGSPKVFSAVNTNMSRSIAEARPQQLPAEENQPTVSNLVEDIPVPFTQDGGRSGCECLR